MSTEIPDFADPEKSPAQSPAPLSPSKIIKSPLHSDTTPFSLNPALIASSPMPNLSTNSESENPQKSTQQNSAEHTLTHSKKIELQQIAHPNLLPSNENFTEPPGFSIDPSMVQKRSSSFNKPSKAKKVGTPSPPPSQQPLVIHPSMVQQKPMDEPKKTKTDAPSFPPSTLKIQRKSPSTDLLSSISPSMIQQKPVGNAEPNQQPQEPEAIDFKPDIPPSEPPPEAPPPPPKPQISGVDVEIVKPAISPLNIEISQDPVTEQTKPKPKPMPEPVPELELEDTQAATEEEDEGIPFQDSFSEQRNTRFYPIYLVSSQYAGYLETYNTTSQLVASNLLSNSVQSRSFEVAHTTIVLSGSDIIFPTKRGLRKVNLDDPRIDESIPLALGATSFILSDPKNSSRILHYSSFSKEVHFISLDNYYTKRMMTDVDAVDISTQYMVLISNNTMLLHTRNDTSHFPIWEYPCQYNNQKIYVDDKYVYEYLAEIVTVRSIEDGSILETKENVSHVFKGNGGLVLMFEEELEFNGTRYKCPRVSGAYPTTTTLYWWRGGSGCPQSIKLPSKQGQKKLPDSFIQKAKTLRANIVSQLAQVDVTAATEIDELGKSIAQEIKGLNEHIDSLFHQIQNFTKTDA